MSHLMPACFVAGHLNIMFTKVSDAAKIIGVTNRTIQRWIKQGKVTKDRGLVSVPECSKCRIRQRTGRKSKGNFRDNPLFWQEKESPAWPQAIDFMQPGKLDSLQDVLAIIAFWHVQEGKTEAFIGALKQALQLTDKMEQKKRNDDPSWQVATGRFLKRQR